jgi:hypothetical protein
MSDLHARNYRDVPHKYNSKNRKCVASFLSLRKQTASVKPTQVSLFPNGKYTNERSYIFHWQKTNFRPLKAIDEKYAFFVGADERYGCWFQKQKEKRNALSPVLSSCRSGHRAHTSIHVAAIRRGGRMRATPQPQFAPLGVNPCHHRWRGREEAHRRHRSGSIRATAVIGVGREEARRHRR